MSRHYKNSDIYHREPPNHLGYNLGRLAGLTEHQSYTFDVALSYRYVKHPHFGDNPDRYFNRCIETFTHYMRYRDSYSYNLLNGYFRDGVFHHGLLGKDLMFFLLHGYFPIDSKYRNIFKD